MGLGLECSSGKERGPPDPKAGAGQGNIRVVSSEWRYKVMLVQARRPLLCSGHGRRAMEGPSSPHAGSMRSVHHQDNVFS